VSDRDAFRAEQQERREHGLKARHETREARAARREVANEIADMALSARHALCEQVDQQPCSVCWALGEIASSAREIGSRDTA